MSSSIWKSIMKSLLLGSSFCKAVVEGSNRSSSHWKLVWTGLAPPKVEAFVWPILNDVVFNGKHLDLLQLIDIIKVRLVWWIMAKWPDQSQPFEDLVCCPLLAKTSMVKKKLGGVACS
ncbi:Receptor-like protein kinase ANXUR2 [Corchorus olitorius]|uniref:Receptor-like protein kinase ANXUR2 n=1 Tax=Corchorus olitorius TaxID=93759 RepID=A0A1R3JE84_9ROSI|nr:Receptor-like protein kinase ANXUR2 [Corchorus olitorius]